MGIEGANITLQNLALAVAIATVVWRLIKLILDIVEIRVMEKVSRHGHLAPLPTTVTSDISSLTEQHLDLKAQMSEGFSSMEMKMETQYRELHRRVSEFKDEYHKSQIHMATHYVRKDDLDKVEDRLRNGSRRKSGE